MYAHTLATHAEALRKDCGMIVVLRKNLLPIRI